MAIGTKVEVDLDRLVAVLNAAGARVTLAGSARDLDPVCDNESITLASQEECCALGLEGLVGHRGATVVVFRAKELRERKKRLDAVVALLLEGDRLSLEEDAALANAAYSLVNSAEDLAARTYLQGFLDGRALRFVSDGIPEADMPRYQWDGCAVGDVRHYTNQHE